MGIYRTYLDKNATIIKNSEVNTGRNPVSELYYGQDVSRFLLYCSFNELKAMVLNKEIIINDNTKHYLKIKNTSSFDISPYLSENNSLMFSDKYRSSSFDLELYLVSESWDEGCGYDFQLNPISRSENRDFSEEPVNWFHRTNINKFSTAGAINNNYLITQQHFNRGNEDVNMDITDIVNSILLNNIITGTTTGVTTGITLDYQGFCLKYTNEHEALNFGDQRTYVLGLFTKYTQSFFEPFIETVYDDHIWDDRIDFYINKTNKLFLYVNVEGVARNLDSIPTCTISSTTYEVKQKTKGVYFIEVFANPQLFDTDVQYNDIWSNIYIDGIRKPDVKLSFYPKDENLYFQMGSTTTQLAQHSVSVSGIKREEKVTQGEKRRVTVHIRKPYTIEQTESIYDVQYKLYVKQGTTTVDVTNWQKVNKMYNTNCFIIDTTWLIPQTYYVDIKITTNGEVLLYNNILKFQLTNTI